MGISHSKEFQLACYKVEHRDLIFGGTIARALRLVGKTTVESSRKAVVNPSFQ